MLLMAGRDILAGALMTSARAMSEFGAVVILAYSPKIIPVRCQSQRGLKGASSIRSEKEKLINDFCPLYGGGSASFELHTMSGIYRRFGGQICQAITHLDVVSPP